jgi:hypothetical protein
MPGLFWTPVFTGATKKIKKPAQYFDFWNLIFQFPKSFGPVIILALPPFSGSDHEFSGNHPNPADLLG